MKYFEDIQIGETWDIGRHTFTADAIKAFAQRFDPQSFHVDEAAAASSHFGALVASGWHTAAALMRLMVDYRQRQDEMMRSRGEAVAGVGPALGFRALKWPKPVYVNDTIHYTVEVTDKRATATRPGLGLLSFRSTGINQHGDVVLSLLSTTFVERRTGRR